MTKFRRKLVFFLEHYSVIKATEEICQVGRILFDKGFVASNDGNLSVRISEEVILTTPTGVSKGFLKPDMLVKLNLQGDVLEGTLEPSSELKMHLRVYSERQDVRAIVHAHPPYATTYAIAGIPLNQAMMPEAVIALGTVPIVEYGTPSTEEIPNAVAHYIHSYHALLLENHGALTWGKDLFSAYFLMESLEFVAKVNFNVKLLGRERELSQGRVQELLDIKEKMGIKGESPLGISCDSGESVCESPLTKTRMMVGMTRSELETLVEMITEKVLFKNREFDSRVTTDTTA